MCAGVELRGADEVADVLEDEKVHAFDIKILQGALCHVCVDVAQPAVVDLQGPDARCIRDPLRVERRLDVDVHLGDVDFILQTADQRGEQGGLAGARCGHDVDEEGAVIREHLPDVRRGVVVLCEDIFVYFDDSDFSHYAFHSFVFSMR